MYILHKYEFHKCILYSQPLWYDNNLLLNNKYFIPCFFNKKMLTYTKLEESYIVTVEHNKNLIKDKYVNQNNINLFLYYKLYVKIKSIFGIKKLKLFSYYNQLNIKQKINKILFNNKFKLNEITILSYDVFIINNYIHKIALIYNSKFYENLCKSKLKLKPIIINEQINNLSKLITIISCKVFNKQILNKYIQLSIDKHPIINNRTFIKQLSTSKVNIFHLKIIFFESLLNN